MTDADAIRQFYRDHAGLYERLVARQDSQGKLISALNDIAPLDGRVVVEFGAGTGHLTLLLAVLAKRVYAFDIERAMLRRANALLSESGARNWSLALGDNANMPVTDDCADLAIEGWSFTHVLDQHPRHWRQQTDRMLAEMRRILKPGGVAIMIEDLGIGRRQPKAPSQRMQDLYAYWVDAHGFSRRWARTDYQFASSAEAEELTRVFFGAELVEQFLSGGRLILPECSGIWWKRF